MTSEKPDVVIMAELDWGGLHCQSHVVAKGFAALGYRVWYINRTLQRWPKWRHLVTRLRPKPSLGVREAVPVPDGIHVVNIWVGPPVRWLRPLNRIILNRSLRKFGIINPLLITYVPTYNCLDLINVVHAKCLTYICYHHFDADVVLPDVLRAEKEIILKSNALFADSRFLLNRISRLSGGREVIQAPPGVYFDSFSKAWRGDETVHIRKICFFGGAGPHLDLGIYNRLCDAYEVHFIAVVQPDILPLLDPRIIITDPVSNEQLPALLHEMDVLTIFYKQSPYIDAVLPAKFFECIATGKPVLVSGLPEASYYAGYVYDANNKAEKALELIRALPRTHTADRVQHQFELGKQSDFANRFHELSSKILSQCPN